MKSIVLAAVLVATAAPAFAGQWTAAPAAKATEQGFTAAGAIWDCDASGCRTTSDTSGYDSMSSCRALAREVGPLTAFVVDGKAYTDGRLASCNGSAPKAKH